MKSSKKIVPYPGDLTGLPGGFADMANNLIKNATEFSMFYAVYQSIGDKSKTISEHMADCFSQITRAPWTASKDDIQKKIDGIETQWKEYKEMVNETI